MKGGMMRVPLVLSHFLDRAATLFPDKCVVTASGGALDRTPWREVRGRVDALTSALASLGVRRGDRVASLAWNHQRHLELYFGVPASGAVLTTVNVRLSPEQVTRVLAHSEPVVVFADPELVPLVDEVAAALPSLGHRIVLDRPATDGPASDTPASSAPTTDSPPSNAPRGWRAYEELLGAAAFRSPPPSLEEDAAAGLCYTSGTTGEPKGVLYSHRALVLHTLGICLPDGFGLREADVILPAVPMFHANAWGLPYAAAMTGSTLVLPGPRPSPERIAELLEAEAVTFAAGVPTVWMGVLDALRSRPRSLAPGLRIHAGGAPSPPALIEAYRTEFGIELLTGWGMTELSPVGMVTHPRGDMSEWSSRELLSVRTSQGTPLPLVEARVVGEDGQPVPEDGNTPGELEVRGPWVAGGYYAGGGGGSSGPGASASMADASGSETPPSDVFRDGWLRTGDVATRDARGYFRLVDRTKDLIRSGGEWISSVQLEHALMDHPDVVEVAVVAVPDPRWQERPWACVVERDGVRVAPEALLASLEGRFPKWWIPDRVILLAALPRTATGKYDKKALRASLRASLSSPEAS